MAARAEARRRCGRVSGNVKEEVQKGSDLTGKKEEMKDRIIVRSQPETFYTTRSERARARARQSRQLAEPLVDGDRCGSPQGEGRLPAAPADTLSPGA